MRSSRDLTQSALKLVDHTAKSVLFVTGDRRQVGVVPCLIGTRELMIEIVISRKFMRRLSAVLSLLIT